MILSADAIGQTDFDASRSIDARTFVTRAAFTEWSDGLANWRLWSGKRLTDRTFPTRVHTEGRRQPQAAGRLNLGDRVCMTAARLVLVLYGGSAGSKRWTVEGPRDQEGPPLTRST
jgi:hypothetical protein